MDWIDYKDDISKFYRGPLDYFNFNYKTKINLHLILLVEFLNIYYKIYFIKSK